MDKIFTKISLIACFLALVILPNFVLGADLSWQAVKEQKDSDRVTIALILDTKNDKINAVSGEINLLSEGWKLESVSNANSFINLWIERPVIGSSNKVNFAGITPGGYIGRGLILKLVFRPLETKVSPNPDVQVNNFSALINDGTGKSADVNIIGLTKATAEENLLRPVVKNDKLIPEIFTPVIVRDSNLPTNQKYLIFNTQDKNSGLSYYAVYETYWPIFNVKKQDKKLSWVVTESPYQLKNQSWWNFIYVKAENQSGGVRIVRLSPQFSLDLVYKYWLLSSIIILIIALTSILFLVRKIYGNKK